MYQCEISRNFCCKNGYKPCNCCECKLRNFNSVGEECQKTGEEFVPRQRGGSAKRETAADDSDKSAQGSDDVPDILASHDEDMGNEDDLSDLYPGSLVM